ncbi:MAG: ATPase domain-containing protein, partial [Candidatus Bathyarchaeota archaeon]
EKKTKFYLASEKMLKLSEDSFIKAKQSEKIIQVQKILKKVKEEKQLAFSINELLHAPKIASSTESFSAPIPNEKPFGLESFEHANVQANLVSNVNQIKVGESFCLSIEFVNAGREPALLLKVEDFVPSDFIVVKKPEIYNIDDTCLNMKGKQLAPLKLVEVKLTLQTIKKGKYHLNPKVHYLDEMGNSKSLRLKPFEIKIEEIILEDRVSSGTQELDSLLLGGIPKEYAVVLTGSPSDERERIINNFLKKGITDDEIVFYVSTEADGLTELLKNQNFVLFLCNPRPKNDIPDHQNVFKLRSKTDLTNLSISLTKANRDMDLTKNKRICIETVSDVLLDYGARASRKWIAELITDLVSKRFTILAVMNSIMHPPDQVNAVLDLFDGELSIVQSVSSLNCTKSIIVKKLRNQDYIKNPICFT